VPYLINMVAHLPPEATPPGGLAEDEF